MPDFQLPSRVTRHTCLNSESPFERFLPRLPAERTWHCGCNKYESIRLDTSETLRSSRAFVPIRLSHCPRSAVSPHAWPSGIGTFLSTASVWNFSWRELRGSRRREQRPRHSRQEKNCASGAEGNEVSIAGLATLHVSHPKPGSRDPGIGRTDQDSRDIAS